MTEAADSEKITVSKVCQDFRVREDGALATRLQDEEFQKHYGMNRNERKTVRGDLYVAKKTYLEEVRTAELLPDDELKKMEETDKWLARELQERLQDEEQREVYRRTEVETRDAQIAKDLQEREKQKLDRARQRKREQEIMAEQERRHLQRATREHDRQEHRTRGQDRQEYVAMREQDQREHPTTREQHDRREHPGMREQDRREHPAMREQQDRRKHNGMREQDRREHPAMREQDRREHPPMREQHDRCEHPVMKEQARQKPIATTREQDRQEQVATREHDRQENTVMREQERQKPIAMTEKHDRQENTVMREHDQLEHSSVEVPPAVNGHVDSVGRQSYSSSSGSEEETRKRRSMGEGAFVSLPAAENGGGRLETDKIIMADGTTIDLFDNEEDRQKALDRDREKALDRDREKALDRDRQKKDEEFAKRLQEQERKIVEQEKLFADDRKLAVEEQDRELAKHLQRKEYQRIQKLQRERQTRRANSMPSERRSSIEDPQHLPSYDEAVHHRQMPDLLQDQEYSDEREMHARVRLQPSSLERSTHSSTDSSQGSSPSSLERGHSSSVDRGHPSLVARGHHVAGDMQTAVWLTQESQHVSPGSSLENSQENARFSHRSSRSSYSSSGQGSCDRSHSSAQPSSPTSRAEVWERLYEAEGSEEFQHSTQQNRPLVRSQTVGSYFPSQYEGDRRVPYNVVEGIDPTFKESVKNPESGLSEDGSEGDKAKVIPLIKPHRRRNGDKKKDQSKESCKQQ